MSRFSECFLLIFGQLAVGGLVGLSVPPFAVMERGFYKSSGGLYLGFALVFLAGKVALAVRAGSIDTAHGVELALWTLFTIAIGVYVATLWGDASARRARAFVAAFFSGLLALAVSASGHRVAGVFGLTTVLYPAAFTAAALAIGAVATGMLLGHWYLIDLGLSIDPLRRLFRYFIGCTVAQLVLMAITIGVLSLDPERGRPAVSLLFSEHRALLLTRLALGPGAALGIGYLIHRTIQIPQTMAATGLFYVASLAVMVGEMLGRLILFRTSIPL